MTEQLITAREVAERLGVSQKWVMTRWRAGRLPGFQLQAGRGGAVRFKWSEIETWLETVRRGPAA